MATVSAEVSMRLRALRAKSLDNTITREEMIEAVRLMAEDRKAAAASAAPRRKASATRPPALSASDILAKRKM